MDDNALRHDALRYDGVESSLRKERGMPPATDTPVIDIRNLTKTYASGFQALKGVDLQIRRGEIFALLGPNGAGKTTLISIVCGIVNASSGSVQADGHDIVRDFRAARASCPRMPSKPCGRR